MNKQFNTTVFKLKEQENRISVKKYPKPQKPRVLSKLDVKFSPEVNASPMHVRMTPINSDKFSKCNTTEHNPAFD
jgi:hypothetical protein